MEGQVKKNRSSIENYSCCETNDINLTISAGFGTSYGGYGTKVSYVVFKEQRIAIQAGAGYYFGDVMFSGGLKFYLWENLYLDAKYSSFSRKYELQYDSNYDVQEANQILEGPGTMLGYEFYLIQNFGINMGAGINYDVSYGYGIFYAYDIGLFYTF